MTGKEVLLEKELLEKAAAVKRFKYFLFRKELRRQTSVSEKHFQYQKFGNAFEFNKKKGDKTKNRRSRAKSHLFYNNYFTFYKYHNTNDLLNILLVQNSMKKLNQIMKINKKA